MMAAFTYQSVAVSAVIVQDLDGSDANSLLRTYTDFSSKSGPFSMILASIGESSTYDLQPGTVGLGGEASSGFDVGIDAGDHEGVMRVTLAYSNASLYAWDGFLIELYDGDFDTRIVPSAITAVTIFPQSTSESNILDSALSVDFASEVGAGQFAIIKLSLDLALLPQNFGIRQTAILGDAYDLAYQPPVAASDFGSVPNTPASIPTPAPLSLGMLGFGILALRNRFSSQRR